MHCPAAALPMVSLLGIEEGCGGQLNSGSSLLYYDLQTTVYNSLDKTSTTFTVSIYFKNGKHWANFPTLTMWSRLFVTGCIFGVTTNRPWLAILVDDVYFIPKISPIATTPGTPGSSTVKCKQDDCWTCRAAPSTPIKRPQVLSAVSKSQTPHRRDHTH
jgi:hypothetical protein